jgi:hypothetical protein
MTDQVHFADARVAAAIRELKELIRVHYPTARFEVSAGPDPGDVYLIVTADSDDSDHVMAVYIDRLVELQVDERLPLYVMSLQPGSAGDIQMPGQATTTAA